MKIFISKLTSTIQNQQSTIINQQSSIKPEERAARAPLVEVPSCQVLVL